MSIIKTEIDGLLIYDGRKFSDKRGQLIKPFSRSYFQEKLNFDFKEVWFTISTRDVIRGMHLQINPFACEKIISVIEGKIEDVILDLRIDSKTYGKYFSIILDDTESKALYIPKGCAHGYKVLSERSIVMYMATEVNVETHDLGIKWNSFGYDWKIIDPILSEKDKNLVDFEFNKVYF